MKQVIKYQVEMRPAYDNTVWDQVGNPKDTVGQAIVAIQDQLEEDFITGESGEYIYRIIPVIVEEEDA